MASQNSTLAQHGCATSSGTCSCLSHFDKAATKASRDCSRSGTVANHAGSCQPTAAIDVLLGDALTGGSLSSMDLPELAREVSRARKRSMMPAANSRSELFNIAAIEDSIDSRRAGTLESQEVSSATSADGLEDAREISTASTRAARAS